jgi:enoyl-CoA hydratase/3-hydroxyacyl-CoA dehydrogenase
LSYPDRYIQTQTNPRSCAIFVFKAGVVGAGTMGAEIAAVVAAAGIPVVLCDVDQRALDAGLERARAMFARQLAAGAGGGDADDADHDASGPPIEAGAGYDRLGDVDIVIEAVPEQLELKLDVFAALDAATPGHAILASNTSSLSISELATATTRPECVLGLHFFNPVALMRLVELVEGEVTSAAALAAAASFAAALRKTVIHCADAPGFVVNRVLGSAISELWRVQEERGLAPAAVDAAIASAKVAPMGPFALADMLGLDTVLAVAERLQDAYGDERFHVHHGLRALVARGELGAKSGGRGFYERGTPRVGDGAGAGEVGQADAVELGERFRLKALVEACLVLEEGVAAAREIDLALMAGAGLGPPPFAAADAAGLGVLLERLRRAEQEWGEGFAPPLILRRLVAQGRLGAAAGQGFFPSARPDPGQDGPVRLESRGDVAIAWLANPPANAISPAVVDGLRALWDGVVAGGIVRVIVIASANPALFCAGADIKALATLGAAAAGEFTDAMNALLLEFGRSRIVTIAAVNGAAFGGGCELAMGADIRIAAQSASFGQPEVKLGIIPGFGGTQRLARLVGAGRALEMNLLGEPIDALEAWESGLVNRVVPDHELLDTALAWARRLAAQAPLAIEQIKRAANGPDLDAGLALEQAGFAVAVASDDAREGTAAFVEKRAARFKGS